MPPEPQPKTAVAFVDGQNLFHAAREAFGYTFPNYDVRALAEAVCQKQGWALKRVRFYTGVPALADNAFWNGFWQRKLAMMVRIALDIVLMAHRREYDVALVFSQDQDLSEVAEEIRLIAREQDRWIKVASAFPVSPTSRNRRGVNKTDWFRIDRATYDACVDPRDYRP